MNIQFCAAWRKALSGILPRKQFLLWAIDTDRAACYDAWSLRRQVMTFKWHFSRDVMEKRCVKDRSVIDHDSRRNLSLTSARDLWYGYFNWFWLCSSAREFQNSCFCRKYVTSFKAQCTSDMPKDTVADITIGKHLVWDMVELQQKSTHWPRTASVSDQAVRSNDAIHKLETNNKRFSLWKLTWISSTLHNALSPVYIPVTGHLLKPRWASVTERTTVSAVRSPKIHGSGSTLATCWKSLRMVIFTKKRARSNGIK